MKVLIVHTLYNVRGGEEVIVENEANQLKQMGLEVMVENFSNDTGLKAFIKFALLPFNFVSYFKFKKTINRFKPDVIHLHNWNFGASPSIIIAAKNCNIPIVHSIHNYRLLCPSSTLYYKGDLFLNSLKSNFPWEAIKKGVYRNSVFKTFWLATTLYLHRKIGTWQSIDKYIINTEFNKKIFINSSLGVTNEQIAVKPNSTLDTKSTSIKEKGDFFLYVGRLNEEKGIKIMLSAFSNSNFELVIIGDGPLRSLVQNSAAIEDNITYKGLLCNNEVKDFMMKASALIFPSIWFEGMPMTIVEAFSVSTVVIASRLGAMESMIQDNVNGLHFEAGSVEGLKQRIKYWNDLSKDAKIGLGKGARMTYEENYTSRKNVNNLISIYNKTISKQLL